MSNAHNVAVTNGNSRADPNSGRAEFDYYSTDPKAVEELLKVETFSDVWEPCVGGGAISSTLKAGGINVVRESDAIDRMGNETLDFLKYDGKWGGDIVTNPPYKNVARFMLKAIETAQEGRKVAMFLKLTSLEGMERYEKVFKTHPPIRIHVFVRRVACHRNGIDLNEGGAIAFVWMIWEKGFQGKPILDWINKGDD